MLPDTVQSRTIASQVIHLTVAYSPISVNMVILANLHTAALRSSFMDFKYLIMFDNFNCTIIGLVFWEGTHIPYPEPFSVSRAIFRILSHFPYPRGATFLEERHRYPVQWQWMAACSKIMPPFQTSIILWNNSLLVTLSFSFPDTSDNLKT